MKQGPHFLQKAPHLFFRVGSTGPGGSPQKRSRFKGYRVRRHDFADTVASFGPAFVLVEDLAFLDCAALSYGTGLCGARWPTSEAAFSTTLTL